MVISVSLRRGALDVVVFLFADVKFTADNRLDAGLFRRIYKMHRSKDIPVVGHRHGRHSQALYPLDELLYITGSIQHGIVGMQVQMDELRGGH